MKIIKVIFILFGFVFSSLVFAQDSTFSSTQTEAIKQIVHDYLVKNPEVLIEASRALQAKEAVKTQKQAVSAIGKIKDKLFNDPNSPTAGNASGNPVVVEFFDYQCGHCKAMQPVIDAILKKNPNLKIVFKELPIFGGDSQFAAQAALAAAKQGKYYDFHTALLNTEDALNKDKVMSIAQKAGLDVEKLRKDMASPEIAKQIRDNFQLAQALRLAGTPSFVFSNKDFSRFDFAPGQIDQNEFEKRMSSFQ